MKRKMIFVFLYAILVSVSCNARNLGQLITDARLLARDPSSSGRARFTDAQVTEFINEAQRDMISDTTCIIKNTSFSLVADTQSYSLPSDFIAMDRVTMDYRTLDETSKKAKDQDNDEWETATGVATDYYVDFSDRTKMFVYPYPSSSSDIGTIRYSYFAQATDMALSADIPYNSTTEYTPFHKPLAYYSAGKMRQIDGDLNSTNFFMSLYLNAKSRFYEYCRIRPAYQPGLFVKTK